MPSELRSETARINGAKSRGPVTPEGKERSSANALKHGLTSRHSMLLACEDEAEFKQVEEDYMSTYQPTNPVERDLVEDMIGAKWRIRRIRTVEVALVDLEIDTTRPKLDEKFARYDHGTHVAVSVKSLIDDSRSVSLLSRYESRLHRIYRQSHQMFMDVRKSVAAGLLQPKPEVPEVIEQAEVVPPPEEKNP